MKRPNKPSAGNTLPLKFRSTFTALWNCVEKGKKANDEWDKAFQEYAKAYPELAKELSRRIKGEFPPEYSEAFENFSQTY